MPAWHLPYTEAGEPPVQSHPSGTGEVSDVTIYVWYLRNIVARRRKAKTYFLAQRSESFPGKGTVPL